MALELTTWSGTLLMQCLVGHPCGSKKVTNGSGFWHFRSGAKVGPSGKDQAQLSKLHVTIIEMVTL